MYRYVFISLIIIPVILSAQISAFGGGGTNFGFIKMDFSSLNESILDVGFPEMEKENMFLMGGIGYAEIITGKFRLLVGGGGIGGSLKSESDTLESEVAVSYGYFLAGAPFRLYRKLFCAVTLGIGGGSSELKLKVLSGNSKFGGPNADGVRVALFEKSYFLLRPGLMVEYQLIPFLRISTDFSYFLPIGGSWKEEGMKTLNAPDFSPSGFYGGISILFGGGTGY